MGGFVPSSPVSAAHEYKARKSHRKSLYNGYTYHNIAEQCRHLPLSSLIWSCSSSRSHTLSLTTVIDHPIYDETIQNAYDSVRYDDTKAIKNDYVKCVLRLYVSCIASTYWTNKHIRQATVSHFWFIFETLYDIRKDYDQKRENLRKNRVMSSIAIYFKETCAYQHLTISTSKLLFIVPNAPSLACLFKTGIGLVSPHHFEAIISKLRHLHEATLHFNCSKRYEHI